MKNNTLYIVLMMVLLVSLGCTKELEDDGFAFFDYTFNATTTANDPIRLNEEATIDFTVEESIGSSSYVMTFTTSGRGTLTYRDTIYEARDDIRVVAGESTAVYTGSTAEAHELLFTIQNANQSPVENTATVTLNYEDLPPPIDQNQLCTAINPSDGIVPETIAASEPSDAICNVMDNDLNTVWTASGDQQWIRFDLGTRKFVTALHIAFDQGDVRVYTFDIQVSNDAENWINVFSDEESLANTELQEFEFSSLENARYVRYLGYGNSVNDENSLVEVTISTIQ